MATIPCKYCNPENRSNMNFGQVEWRKALANCFSRIEIEEQQIMTQFRMTIILLVLILFIYLFFIFIK